MITFVNRSASKADQHNVHNSTSSGLMPSHQQDSDLLILQCTLSNSQYQESYQTGLSNPFHNTYEEHRLQAASGLNETTKSILLEELRHVDFRNPYQIKTANAHLQQWLKTQAHNVNNRFSVPIEPIKFSWTEIGNIVRNFSSK